MPATTVGPPDPVAWVGSRVARPAADLARSTAFYRDLLGLRPRGGFTDHDGYDGVFFALPGSGELELTAGPCEPDAGTDDDLLVLYVGTVDEVRAVTAHPAQASPESSHAGQQCWTGTAAVRLPRRRTWTRRRLLVSPDPLRRR